MTSADKPLL